MVGLPFHDGARLLRRLAVAVDDAQQVQPVADRRERIPVRQCRMSRIVDWSAWNSTMLRPTYSSAA
jgi:hypothetical protein